MKLEHPVYGGLRLDKDDDGEKIFVVSDLHLNHDRNFIWKKNGFDSSEEYMNYIFGSLNRVANNNSYLISLGDTTFADPKGVIFDMFASLPFKQIFGMAGNHHSGLNYFFKNTGLTRYKNFSLIGSNIALHLSKLRYIVLSHFPVLDWDTNAYGCLCGHCHGDNEHLNETSTKYGKIFDVGVPNAMRLFNRPYFTLSECVDILKYKKLVFNEDKIHANRKIEELSRAGSEQDSYS